MYGYSWDMMVHSWHTQHIKISFVDQNTNKTHYLNPRAWTGKRRWSSHGDMIHQYADCIKHRLNAMDYTNVTINMDIWRSMNHRFNQRQIDPRVDLATAEWNYFKQTKWIMPLLSELSEWRVKMNKIEKKYESESNQSIDLTFVADFNGLKLENFISNYLNVSIEVLSGRINVEFEHLQLQESTQNDLFSSTNQTFIKVKKNQTLSVGERVQVSESS